MTAVASGSATVTALSGQVSGSASIVVSQTAATVEITAAGSDAAAGVEGMAEITVLPPFPPPDLTRTYVIESLVGVSTGGARLDAGVEDYDSGRPGYTSRVDIEWSAPPSQTLERITVHQYPHWDTWTARIGRVPRDAFIDGLTLDRQRLFVTWQEKILDALQRCTGDDGDVATLLSGLSGNPTALRGRP